jgi:hypothetical protein
VRNQIDMFRWMSGRRMLWSAPVPLPRTSLQFRFGGDAETSTRDGCAPQNVSCDGGSEIGRRLYVFRIVNLAFIAFASICILVMGAVA